VFVQNLRLLNKERMKVTPVKEYYKLRTCYVNFAEHLQNCWNVNFMYNDAPGTWKEEDWHAFFKEIKAFGFTNFQFWIPPTLCKADENRVHAVEQLNTVIRICHEEGLTANPLIIINMIGADWYFACPNDPADREKIWEFWTFYAKHLKGVDIYTIFPGDPGGCNRNGCNHNTFLDLSAELSWMLKKETPGVTVDINTWGSPYTGWGEDMRVTPNWDGYFAMVNNPELNTPESPFHIWNGPPHRVEHAMTDTLKKLPSFPEDTIFSINLGFNGDCEPIGAYDARPWAKQIAEKHRIASWDYAASEGELICYPHYRVDKYRRKRIMEVETAPYYGGICYTMSPKLNLLTLYTAAQLMIDPYRDAAELSAEFTEKVFGDPAIGKLMEAFEIVPGWGYEPRNIPVERLREMFTELIERLKAAEGRESSLPLFPTAEEYRQTLLWHAENFLYMLGENPDREKIRKAYWDQALSIYDTIPMAVDERSALASQGYANIGKNLE